MTIVNATSLPHSLIAMVLARYKEPGRFYHGVDHIHGMFAKAEELGLWLTQAQALAILFHDVVYVPGVPAGMNERLSAQVLRIMAFEHAAPSTINQAAGFIVDTSTHQATSEDSKWVLDLDLAGLALPYSQFLHQGELIYLEYRALVLDKDEFNEARATFLEGMAARPTIYSSAEFAGLEQLARANIHALCNQELHYVRDSASLTGTA